MHKRNWLIQKGSQPVVMTEQEQAEHIQETLEVALADVEIDKQWAGFLARADEMGISYDDFAKRLVALERNAEKTTNTLQTDKAALGVKPYKKSTEEQPQDLSMESLIGRELDKYREGTAAHGELVKRITDNPDEGIEARIRVEALKHSQDAQPQQADIDSRVRAMFGSDETRKDIEALQKDNRTNESTTRRIVNDGPYNVRRVSSDDE